MKKIIYLLLALIMLTSNRLISQTQIHHTLRFDTKSLSFETVSVDSLTFTKVNYTNGCEKICDKGNPELPVMYYTFIIPHDKIVNRVTLNNRESVNYTLSNPIYPVQEPQATCIDCEEPDFCLPNRQVYSSLNIFPSDKTVSTNYGYFDGNCHILTLGICPFEYLPALGQLNFLTSFDLIIDLESDNDPQSVIPIKRLRHSQDLYNQILSSLVENKEQINICYTTAPTIVDEIGPTTTGLPAYEYVIVTSQDYASAFDDFVAWKKQKGIDIGIVTIEDIFNDYDGDQLFDGDDIFDNAGKLRQYLYEAYTQGTVYALLAGDFPLMPIRYGCSANNTNNENYVIPTDLYFADFNGNWNADHDDCYGEPTEDNPDYVPEIFIGRLICSSVQDIDNWVNKLLLYEKNPGNGNTSYLINSFMIEADNGQHGNQAENLSSYLNMFNHTIWRELPEYNSRPPFFPKGSDVVNELNTHHYGLMTWLVHGGTGAGESGIATMTYGNHEGQHWKLQAQERFPYYGAEYDSLNGLDNLYNYDNPFVIYANSCYVVPFDKTSISNNGARNCGEAFTVDNLAGGVAFLGNCREGYWSLSYNLYVSFINIMDDLINNHSYANLGVLESLSKANHPTSVLERTISYGHNLIGDPECSLWTCIPENLSVSIQPQSAILNRDNYFQITIDNLDYDKKAVVTLYKSGDLYDVIEVTGNQQNYAIVNFDHINPSTLGEITFTVTSFGCLPYQENIDVYENCEVTISGTEIWQDDDIVNCDVVIDSGAILTITSEIHFITGSKIIVKPGGRLILDGCRLTNACSDGMWQGIEVWGDSYAHQYLINGEYQQGYVELKNGATIENAVCALELWHPGYMTSTGGIVSAANAVFRNNAKAVHALHYSNHNPISGRETDYNAVFTRCEFVVDDDYLGGEDNVFYTHINLDHVRGFKFRACDFSLETSSDNISHRANGIAGKEAGFSVIGICNNSTEYPCTLFKPSTFSGFFAAINAVSNGSKSAPAITVNHSDFSNNDFGVYMRKLSNSTIVFCNFDVKRQDDWSCGAGIFSDDVFNFIIEENTLKKENDFNGDAYGIIIKNSRGQNQIYRNTLNNLYCGNLAQGINTVQGNSLNYLGLEYRCNTNRGNDIDFYVLKENGVVSGIQSLQGSSTAAAGNTFSRNGYHFYNGGDHTVSYYYDCTHAFNNETPLIYNDNKFVPIPTKQSDGCPSNYLGEDEPVSFVLPPIERQQRERDYREAYTAYNSLKAVYDSRVDGGNTSRMLSDIASASSSDMWTLRSRLLGASPYLSGDVLLATSDRDDVFNESVLFEILMSNPDELKNDTLMNHLRFKDNPLPQYMTDILSRLAVDTTATLKTLMQNTMSELRSKYSRAAGDIVRSLVNDTVLNIGELRGWLGNMEDIHADRDIIATYIDEGNFTDALALANMLPTLYGLTGANLAEHNDYVDLLELYRDIYSDGRNTMQLNESETAMVEHIADYGSGYSQIMAQAVLGETDWKDYLDNVFECPTVTLPRNSGSQTYGSYFDDGDISLAVGMNFTVSPNPATTWVSVDYILPNDATKASLDVVNSFSEKVMSVEVSNNSGQEVLDLRNLATGVYILILRCGEYVQMNKLIVTQ